MLIDITLKITPQIAAEAKASSSKELAGHLGTHFDVMNKDFPLEYTNRNGIVFDVSCTGERDIDISDIDIDKVQKEMFVAFYTGYIEKIGYGGKKYFKEHPQLSTELISALIERGVSLIGVDFAGVRRGKEHTPTDQHCADNGVFIIENLCNLRTVADTARECIFHTYPMSFTEITGLPCRVIAEV